MLSFALRGTDELSRKTQASFVVAGVATALVLSFYIINFAVLFRMRDISDPSAWAQFGDYFGGILNPIIAGLAFYWLTQSVRIQQAEMTESRKALQESSDALSRQVLAAERTAEINGLSGLLAFYAADLSRLTQEAGRLDQALHEMGSDSPRSSIALLGVIDRNRLEKNLGAIRREIDSTRQQAKAALNGLNARLLPLQSGSSGDGVSAPSID